MLLRIPAQLFLLMFLMNILIGTQAFSQTPLSFTSIPSSDPDLNAPGRGVEQWHDQNVVNVPTEGVNTQRLDVYYRFVWTKIEGSTMGSYNWKYFDSLVNNAISKRQKMSFGIMPLYPGGTTQQGLVSFDGGLASYPLYLHNLMQSESVKDWKVNNVWTPNYNSTNYLNRLLALHQAIDAHIKSTSFNGVPYRNVIGCIDLRGYGAWGEWHSGYTPNNVVSDYPAGTFPTIATLKKIVDAHTQGFPDFPLVAMIAAFDANLLANTMNPPEIAYYVLTQRNSWGLIGWRRDQWGATDSYIANYLENNTRTFNGLVFKDSIMVRWRSAPITGEPPGWNPNNYSDLERQIRLYHAASFGNGNYGTSPTSTIKTRVRASSKACGYRLIIESGSLRAACSNVSITLNWKNTGQAPTYENWNVLFELKNSSNVVVWTGTSSFKPRLFLPASSATSITDNFTLPAGLPAIPYNLNVVVRDPNGYRDPLPLAITGRNADGSYTVAQISTVPVLSSNLSATATSGTAFSYHPTSATQGVTYSWRRDAVPGISNAAATGTDDINETLVNTTTSPVSVTYVYTLSTDGCSNTQNVVVTVNPVNNTNCIINGSIISGFNATSIPAGRRIWFSSVIDRGSISGSGTITFNITNGRITFTANNQQYSLSVPNARVRYDPSLTSASTQFINNVWETAIPRSYNGDVFMSGLNYQVPVNFPGNISNITWSATITIDKDGVRPSWKWAAAVYTSLGAHSGLAIKPRDGKDPDPFQNNDNAGTPENYISSVVPGAKGSGGTNYTGDYSSSSTATCSTSGQRPAEPVIVQRSEVKKVPELPAELLYSGKLEALAAPNPSNGSFDLVIRGSRNSFVTVKIIDISGRVVERHDKIPANNLFRVGKRLAAGYYFIDISQGKQRKMFSVIKTN